MDMLVFILFGILIAFGIVALRRSYAEFPGQKPEHYADTSPIMDMRQHLNGPMVCEGVIYGPLGQVTSSFVADFDITWDGDAAVMTEEFSYNDGSTQSREWRITMTGDQKFDARADDVLGAGKGTISGSSIQMMYAIRLPMDAGGHVLNARDWMYLTANGTIINRSQFRKFGLRVAELVATIRPKDAG